MYMNIKEASEYLGIHTVTAYRLLKQKKLPGFRVGGQWRFTREKLDEYFLKMK